jgi:5'-deoxynucleotidase YfbR-like HD superfamily hydrolase
MEKRVTIVLDQLIAHVKLSAELNRTDRALNIFGRPETTSEHTLGMLYIFNYTLHLLTLKSEEVVAIFRTILGHDHPECITGDKVHKTQEQYEIEEQAALALYYGRPELFGIYKEYTEKETEVARIVKELDILQGTLTIYLFHRTKFLEVQRKRSQEDKLFGCCIEPGRVYSDMIIELRNRMEQKGYFIFE